MKLSVQSPALRAGLRALLSEDPEIALEENGDDDVGYAREADVVISTSIPQDWPSQTGTQFAPSGAILILHGQRVDVRRFLLSSHPWGVLPLDASADELRSAIHALAAGLVVGSSSLLSIDGETAHTEAPLSEREVEVLGLLAKGLANKQIAVQLGISEHTVKFHVSSIYNKLDAANRTQAVREGLRNGWIVL